MVHRDSLNASNAATEME